MGEVNTGPRHPLSGADPVPYFVLHVVPPGYHQEGEGTAGTWGSIARHSFGGWGSLALVGRPP